MPCVFTSSSSPATSSSIFAALTFASLGVDDAMRGGGLNRSDYCRNFKETNQTTSDIWTPHVQESDFPSTCHSTALRKTLSTKCVSASFQLMLASLDSVSLTSLREFFLISSRRSKGAATVTFLFLFSPVETPPGLWKFWACGSSCFVLVFRNEIKKGRDNGEIKSLKTRASGTAIARNQMGNKRPVAKKKEEK